MVSLDEECTKMQLIAFWNKVIYHWVLMGFTFLAWHECLPFLISHNLYLRVIDQGH
jgi:DNA-binding ferritin-like protein